MRAMEDVDRGQDLTPALPPLAFSLLDSALQSYCSSCFSPLRPLRQFPPILPSFPTNPLHVSSPPTVLYCSHQCSVADSHLHFSSAEHHLFLHQSHLSDTSDLRLALRLLYSFEQFGYISASDGVRERFGGLMSNRKKLMCREGEEHGDDYDDFFGGIRESAKVMARARRTRDGLNLEFDEECVVEEAVLCVVLTNAVEVQPNCRSAVGIAVYDTLFSWINHSCTPNACYRFLQPGSVHCSDNQSKLRLVQAAMNGGAGETELQCKCELEKGCPGNGPRVIVRSIKAIKEGEEVCIAYIDLLQPKAMRQSELWLKYRFSCCCRRCSAFPPTYVDHSLQEISIVNLENANLSSDHNFYIEKAIKKLADYVDNAITEFMSSGNAICCCEKLEYLLTNGLLEEQLESKEEKLPLKFKLHPLHYLSLNAYTTLASAYKICATDLLAVNPESDKRELEAFNLSRISAAYSLLLAATTHHLFLSEPSLIASAANFWTSAGESLLNLSQSSLWNLLIKKESAVSELPSFPCYKCNECTLLDSFKNSFACSQDHNTEFEDISGQFIDCISNVTPKIWSFLNHESCYFKLIKDLIYFRWHGTLESSVISDLEAQSGSIGVERIASRCESQYGNPERINLFHLGVHCLLYGGFLSSICYGAISNSAYTWCSIIHGQKILQRVLPWQVGDGTAVNSGLTFGF